MGHVERLTDAMRITPAQQHFFFGYYDRAAVSPDGRYHLAVHPGFMDRSNNGGDRAEMGVIDLADENRWLPLDEATAWNWQMGANQHWLGANPRRIVYNVRDGRRVFARIRDVTSRETRDLTRPIYAVSKDGRFAMSVNFARIHCNRPGYGYADTPDPWAGVAAPGEDGLYCVDLSSGDSRLVVSLAQCRNIEPIPSFDVGAHWFNHIAISSKGSRVMFLHRWQIETGGWWTRLYTCNPDGSALYLLNKSPGISHCDWRDEEHILSFCQHGSEEWAFYVLKDTTQEAEVLPRDLLPQDGHCSYRPDGTGRWFANDTYPDKKNRRQTLMLFDIETSTRIDLGRFLALPGGLDDEIRCDLHPRWDPSGRFLTFDSIHEGYRGIYMVDVGEIVA